MEPPEASPEEDRNQAAADLSSRNRRESLLFRRAAVLRWIVPVHVTLSRIEQTLRNSDSAVSTSLCWTAERKFLIWFLMRRFRQLLRARRFAF